MAQISSHSRASANRNRKLEFLRTLKQVKQWNMKTFQTVHRLLWSCRMSLEFNVSVSVLSGRILPLWASPVTVPSPAGLPSWSRHFQSMPRTTRAPGTMYFITWERNRRRWRRRFASASFTALPEGRRQMMNGWYQTNIQLLHQGQSGIIQQQEHKMAAYRAGPHRRRWRCRTARVRTETDSESDRWRSSPSVWSWCVSTPASPLWTGPEATWPSTWERHTHTDTL